MPGIEPKEKTMSDFRFAADRARKGKTQTVLFISVVAVFPGGIAVKRYRLLVAVICALSCCAAQAVDPPGKFTDPALQDILYLAIYRNDIAEVKRLLSSGLDVTIKYEVGRSPLIEACVLLDRLEMVKLLLAHGADPNVVNSDGDTPLHIMAKFGETEKCKVLLDGGADPTLKNKAGMTPADVARKYKRAELAAFIKGWKKGRAAGALVPPARAGGSTSKEGVKK